MSEVMQTLTQAANSPGILLALMGAVMMGPAGLVAALRAQGWTPVRRLRSRAAEVRAARAPVPHRPVPSEPTPPGELLPR